MEYKKKKQNGQKNNKQQRKTHNISVRLIRMIIERTTAIVQTQKRDTDQFDFN